MIDRLIAEQRKEISSYLIYKRLSEKNKNPKNSETLKKISDNELEHYNTLKQLTNKDVKPRRLFMMRFYIIARLFRAYFRHKAIGTRGN